MLKMLVIVRNQDKYGASLMAQMLKNLPAMRETWVPSLGWEDPLENSMDCIVHGVAELDRTEQLSHKINMTFEKSLCDITKIMILECVNMSVQWSTTLLT